jgi:hypothetical protein
MFRNKYGGWVANAADASPMEDARAGKLALRVLRQALSGIVVRVSDKRHGFCIL